MISYHNGVFHIGSESFSYLFRITPQGYPEHLHFGRPVTLEDVEALAVKPGLGWGCSIIADKDSNTCLNTLPLEWSSSGRGDYRESPIACNFSGMDFRYQSHRIIDGPVPMECALPQAQEPTQTLELILRYKELDLVLYYSDFGDTITRRTVLRNGTDSTVCLTKLMSYAVDLPGEWNFTNFYGDWIAEMRKNICKVGSARIVNESTTGFSSNQHQPGFLLSAPGATEDYGDVYGFNLIYSGNHYASAQRSFQGLTRIMQGISQDNFSLELLAGQSFETPEAVLAYASDGFNGLRKKLHRFVNEHIVPEYWRYRQRPVLYNSWEGCGMDFNHRRLMSLAKDAAELGCELFVLDDGWFGNRSNDTAGLGDYWVNTKKLTKGLKGLGNAIKKLGMKFGLWFEPEAVNPDSDLYRAHPDWALRDDMQDIYGRNELLLDLTKPEVRDYIVENVCAVLDSAPISYVKWDMNRHSTALGVKAHTYILGLYEVLDRIFGPRPQILLETCASGGNRFDLGMLCFGPQIWCSDNTDPIDRLTIQTNLSYLYPQSTFGAHVSAAPHAQTLRNTPLTTRGNVAFFGCLGYELDLKHLLPVEKKEIRDQILYYKEHRNLLQFGVFSAEENADALYWQVSKEDRHIAGVFHRLLHAAPECQRLKVKNLKENRKYQIISRKQKLRVGEFGGLVKHIAPVNLDPNGFVLRTADHHYALPDGSMELTASSGALSSGIMLNGRFCGTGYDPNMRQQGDFSSNVFLISPIE